MLGQRVLQRNQALLFDARRPVRSHRLITPAQGSPRRGPCARIPVHVHFTIPIDVAHSVWNEGEEQVRFLNTIVPARYLDYFHELSLGARDGKLAAPEDMKRVMGKYGPRPVV